MLRNVCVYGINGNSAKFAYNDLYNFKFHTSDQNPISHQDITNTSNPHYKEKM